MPFECKKYHCRCQAHCCGIVPIPLRIWQKNQNNIHRQPTHKTDFVATNKATGLKERIVLPITDDLLCPFLKEDLSCAIYDQRPEVCKKYGDESVLLMCCPMQKKDGTPRTVEETQKLEKDLEDTSLKNIFF